jgi:hypothetical protein
MNQGIKSRARRLLFLVVLFGCLTTISPAPPDRPPPGPGWARLVASQIHLDPLDPSRRRVGALVFRRGWHLTSIDSRFGGLSAMHVDRGRVVALSDTGVVISFALPATTGSVGPVRFIPLMGPGPRVRKSNRDTEALVVSGRQAWVGFENHNMIWRYDSTSWKPQASARPHALRNWKYNSGAESLVGLSGGRFLALGEGVAASGFSHMTLFLGDPASAGTPSVNLRYRHLEGFRPTDAALLPGNRLLVLNRRASLLGGIVVKLAIIDLGKLNRGAVLDPIEIAHLAAPLAVDNMEALSVARESGRIVVRIASDDNFIALQRTLLLEFWLDDDALQRRMQNIGSARPV